MASATETPMCLREHFTPSKLDVLNTRVKNTLADKDTTLEAYNMLGREIRLLYAAKNARYPDKKTWDLFVCDKAAIESGAEPEDAIIRAPKFDEKSLDNYAVKVRVTVVGKLEMLGMRTAYGSLVTDRELSTSKKTMDELAKTGRQSELDTKSKWQFFVGRKDDIPASVDTFQLGEHIINLQEDFLLEHGADYETITGMLTITERDPNTNKIISTRMCETKDDIKAAIARERKKKLQSCVGNPFEHVVVEEGKDYATFRVKGTKKMFTFPNKKEHKETLTEPGGHLKLMQKLCHNDLCDPEYVFRNKQPNLCPETAGKVTKLLLSLCALTFKIIYRMPSSTSR